jgi:RNA polymerase sigma-70 factor (ECF subfamily)
MELPLQLAGIADDTAAADERMLLRAALSRLSNEHREVIVLRFYQGLDYKDIAQTLEIAEGTVKSRLHRAIAALKQEMEGGRHNVQTA